MTRPNDALHELAVKAAHEWNAGVPAQEIDINAMVAYVLAATPPRSDARAVELLRDVRDHLWPSQSEEWTAEARHLVDRIDAILALRDSLPQSVVNDTPAIPNGYRLVCKVCGSIPGDVCLAPSRCPVEKEI